MADQDNPGDKPGKPQGEHQKLVRRAARRRTAAPESTPPASEDVKAQAATPGAAAARAGADPLAGLMAGAPVGGGFKRGNAPSKRDVAAALSDVSRVMTGRDMEKLGIVRQKAGRTSAEFLEDALKKDPYLNAPAGQATQMFMVGAGLVGKRRRGRIAAVVAVVLAGLLVWLFLR